MTFRALKFTHSIPRRPQIFKVDEVHALILSAGAREGLPPTTLGNVARISMILDPDGNWIELSQRASIVGPLT